jgi:chemotaxis protein CheD
MPGSSTVAVSAAPRSRPIRERVSLGLGAAILVERPSVVRTVLGSCVAVILHVPRLGISALCHAQLPELHSDGRCRGSCPVPCRIEAPATNNLRYVTCCIRHMLTELHCRRVSNQELVATVVGGANVLESLSPRWSMASRNVETALATLERLRIPVAFSDTGGTRGRVIQHLSDLNRTHVKYHGAER